ncbi:MAG: methionyl-tRNA formyltransferase [Alphaproteobacteria bacterium]|nr:methionyl-tRNA formyltransferase [Alphaproteobacteria bacterium]
MNANGPRLAFLGTPDFAASSLGALIEAGHKPVCVYAQPARPAGRGQRAQPSAVERLARAHDIEVRTPVTLRDAEAQAAFAALDLDLAIVAAYGLILPAPILAAPRRGCVNVHASLLPRWRGAAPIQRALLAGDTVTGITLMQMDAGLDTGAMLRSAALPIGPDTTGGTLHDALAACGARLLVDSLPDLLAGRLLPMPQPTDGVTYAAKIDRAELRLDWRQPAVVLERTVRAFAPRPGAYAERGGERIKVLGARVEARGGAPGTLLDDRLLVACGDGALRLTTLQRAGKGPLAADAFLRGFALPAGSAFDV